MKQRPAAYFVREKPKRYALFSREPVGFIDKTSDAHGNTRLLCSGERVTLTARAAAVVTRHITRVRNKDVLSMVPSSVLARNEFGRRVG